VVIVVGLNSLDSSCDQLNRTCVQIVSCWIGGVQERWNSLAEKRLLDLLVLGMLTAVELYPPPCADSRKCFVCCFINLSCCQR
jgi:hypothetical protein